MGSPILVRCHLYIESGPRLSVLIFDSCNWTQFSHSFLVFDLKSHIWFLYLNSVLIFGSACATTIEDKIHPNSWQVIDQKPYHVLQKCITIWFNGAYHVGDPGKPLNMATPSCSKLMEIYLVTAIHLPGLCAKRVIDGLAQESRNSTALAMELRLSYTNPSSWSPALILQVISSNLKIIGTCLTCPDGVNIVYCIINPDDIITFIFKASVGQQPMCKKKNIKLLCSFGAKKISQTPSHVHRNRNIVTSTKFCHWLHQKLSFSQLPMQPMTKILSTWQHFHFSVDVIIMSLLYQHDVTMLFRHNNDIIITSPVHWNSYV